MTSNHHEIDESDVVDIYRRYAVVGLQPAEIGAELDVSLARVHELLAYYYDHVQDLEDNLHERVEIDEEVDSGRDRDYITDTRKPHEDIDVGYDVDMLRMERLGSDGLYIAGYTDDDNEPDYRYWVVCDDNGLRIDEEHHPNGIKYE